MKFENLEKNICDTIKEGQIKIGYTESSLSLFYPLESVAQLLEISPVSSGEMEDILKEFRLFCEQRLGNIEISQKEQRFCFTVSKEGVRYVHEKYRDNPFLRKFLEEITKPGCSIGKILEVFHSFSDEVHYEADTELGDIVYFCEESVDEYVYCMKFDEFGATYHRFTRDDYRKLIR